MIVTDTKYTDCRLSPPTSLVLASESVACDGRLDVADMTLEAFYRDMAQALRYLRR
jgi:hypothetical protein